MHAYDLTIENGVITRIDNTDADGNTVPGVLYIPAEATSFSPDVWVHLGCETDGIIVHEDNPVFSSFSDCLLSKNGEELIKICKNSDISKLSGLKVIGSDAFHTMGMDLDEFVFRIPDGVEMLDYRAFAICADKVKITVPASVIFVDLLAFLIHSRHTHIIFEGDPHLRIGAFGTEAEAEDTDFEVYKSLPSVLYPKAENITVTCLPDSRVSAYCKKYGIPEVSA